MTNFQCRSKEIFIFFAFTAAGLSIFMDYNFLLFILPMRYWDLYCELVASKIFIHSVLHQLVSGFSSLEDFFLWISSPFCNPLGPDDRRIFQNFIAKKASIIYQDEEYFDKMKIKKLNEDLKNEFYFIKTGGNRRTKNELSNT